MNIHHLELFYYVAKHGGISEAVRNMPSGFEPVTFGVFWNGKTTPVLQALVGTIQQAAKALMAGTI